MSSAATGICSGRPLDRQNARLAQQGIRAELKRSKAGRTVSQFAALSSLGIETKPLLYAQRDPRKAGLPTANFEFDYSFGDPQPVQAFARRSLGAVTLIYRANGGPTQSAPTAEWQGGQKDTPATVHHRQMRGVVTGTDTECCTRATGPYAFGAYQLVLGDGIDANRDPFPPAGVDDPFRRRPGRSTTATAPAIRTRPRRRSRQRASCRKRSSRSSRIGRRATGTSRAAPFAPRSGDPSSDTDPRWDHLLVEARTAGGAN